MESKKLEDYMEKFIAEAMEFERASAQSITQYQIHLLGMPSPLPPIGYLRFLKSLGRPDPDIMDLSSSFIGQYWEFLVQYHGTHTASRAMKALYRFWKWCRQNEYIIGEPPPDLIIGSEGPTYPFQVRIMLRQRP